MPDPVGVDCGNAVHCAPLVRIQCRLPPSAASSNPVLEYFHLSSHNSNIILLSFVNYQRKIKTKSTSKTRIATCCNPPE
eukprot:scaffold47404_cov71-Cyclotella_meneghiniana.AAC.4